MVFSGSLVVVSGSLVVFNGSFSDSLNTLFVNLSLTEFQLKRTKLVSFLDIEVSLIAFSSNLFLVTSNILK